MKEEETSFKEKQKANDSFIRLSRNTRIFVFTLLILTEMATNNSTGLLSSASKNIKRSLKMNDKEFGMFGTSNAVGRVIGSFLFIFIVNLFPRKWLFISFIFIKSFLWIFFKLTNNGWLLIGTRFLIGWVHMPPSIYIPVWIDQFGIQSLKTPMMTWVQVVQPSGKVFGYFLHIIFGLDNWQLGFVFEGVFLQVIIAIMFFVPDIYFSDKVFVVQGFDGKDKVARKGESSNAQRISVFKETENVSMKRDETKVSFFSDLCEIFKNIVFLNVIIVRAILYGANTAFHFWISDYMRNVLHVTNSSHIFISYTIIAIAGPVGGIIASSLISSFLGGYDNKHSSDNLLILHCLTCVFAIAMPFIHEWYGFCIDAALYLVFLSAALSFVQGIIITCVSPKLKGSASSIANLVTIVLTSGPGPVVYGAINDIYKEDKPNMALLCVMLFNVVGILFIIILSYFRRRQYTNKKSIQRLVDKKVGIQNNLADDIAGAINENSLDIRQSIHRNKEGLQYEEHGEKELELK